MSRVVWLACCGLAFLTSPLSAQMRITEAELTPEAAERIAAFYNRPETIRFGGEAQVAPNTELGGDVAVLGGDFMLAGHVRGSLLIINGSVQFARGARVAGDITIVGGAIRGVDSVSARSITWYRETLRYELTDGQLFVIHEERRPELSAGREFGFGRTDLLIAARGAYNRVEGLPVHIGPRVTMGGSNPTAGEALFVLRTAAGVDFGEDDFGYALRLEQYIGGRRAARVGFRYAREILPIEQWGLSDRESSLAAFVLHRDYRDHYERSGWSAYLRLGRAGTPLDFTLEFRNAEYASAPARDPLSILHNGDSWRREPAIFAARLHTLETELTYDTRNDRRDPATGWLAHAFVELALGERGGAGASAPFSRRYRYGLVDVRRFARLTPNSRLALRALAAGSINDQVLPVYRQQALGGEASLPGYEQYEFDCGAHSAPADAAGFSPFYGCERLALLQLEYQSNFRALSRFGRSIGRDFGLLGNIRWSLFFDAGRAWTEPESRGSRAAGTDDFVADAGAGLRFGPISIYWAVPLSSRSKGVNFFMRLGPRI